MNFVVNIEEKELGFGAQQSVIIESCSSMERKRERKRKRDMKRSKNYNVKAALRKLNNEQHKTNSM